MNTLALNIRMHDKLVVIVGGGAVALRKILTLQATGASLRVVAMNIHPEIAELERSRRLEIRVGSYAVEYLDKAFMVIAATDSTLVNRQVLGDARELGILAVVADNPAAGDCTFPAVLKRGDLEIAVSTGGRCPTFAVDVRDRIEGHIGFEYGAILERLAGEREKLLTNGSSSTYNTQVLRSQAERLLAELSESKGLLP